MTSTRRSPRPEPTGVGWRDWSVRSVLAASPFSVMLAAGLAAELAVGALDAVTSAAALISALLVLPPLVVSLTGRWGDTAVIVLVALALVLVKPAGLHDDRVPPTCAIPLLLVLLGGAVAIAVALVRAGHGDRARALRPAHASRRCGRGGPRTRGAGRRGAGPGRAGHGRHRDDRRDDRWRAAPAGRARRAGRAAAGARGDPPAAPGPSRRGAQPRRRRWPPAGACSSRGSPTDLIAEAAAEPERRAARCGRCDHGRRSSCRCVRAVAAAGRHEAVRARPGLAAALRGGRRALRGGVRGSAGGRARQRRTRRRVRATPSASWGSSLGGARGGGHGDGRRGAPRCTRTAAVELLRARDRPGADRAPAGARSRRASRSTTRGGGPMSSRTCSPSGYSPASATSSRWSCATS